MKELEQSKIESRREVHIPINLKGLYKGYTKIFFDTPVNAFDWVTRNIERASKKMTTGIASVVTLPLGIMVRNGATVANETLNSERDGRGKYVGWGIFGAGCGAVAATWFAGAAIFAKLGAVSSAIGSIGAGVVAGVLAAPVIAPALAVGMIATGVITGAIAFTLSTVPAIANIKVGMSRTWDSLRGVKYTAEMKKQLEQEASRDSISYNYEARQLSKAAAEVARLPKEGQINIYESLKNKFQRAAEKVKEQEYKDMAEKFQHLQDKMQSGFSTETAKPAADNNNKPKA